MLKILIMLNKNPKKHYRFRVTFSKTEKIGE